jgi:hypothetical protein
MPCLFHSVQMYNSYSSCAKAKTNVLPSIFLYLVLDGKGNEVVGKGKASTTLSSVSYIICPTHVFTFIFFLGKGLYISLFLVLNAKGGEINRPKQNDRTTTLFSENFFIAFAKTRLTTKGRTFQEELSFSQRKSI